MKRKKNKKVNKRLVITTGVVVTFLLILFLIFLFGRKLFEKDYYVVQSRVNNIEEYSKDVPDGFETVGWLQIQGTNIDYPLLYNSEWNYPGSMDGYGKMAYYEKGFHNHFEISGHNLFNLSSEPLLKDQMFTRFEELMSFVYYDFAKENKYIQLTYEGEEYVYKVFMAGFISLTDIQSYFSNNDLDKDQMKAYLSEIKKNSIYDYDVDVSNDDKIISLSTCTRFYGVTPDWKFFVVGRLLRKNEKMNDFSVTKNDRYKEIEKILKGDESNEEV